MPPAVYRYWQRRLPADAHRAIRLAFAYMASDGHVRQIVGASFDKDYWWRIDVERSKNGQIEVRLGQQLYLRMPVEDMLSGPTSKPFWLGQPPFGDGSLLVEIGGFTLRAQQRGNLQRRDIVVSASFDMARDDLLIDTSGWGHHGKLASGSLEWMIAPERARPLALKWSAPAGEAYVIQTGPLAVVELLRTQGQFGLDSEFTGEMWFRTEYPYYRQIAVLDSSGQVAAAGGSTRCGGWSLKLINRNEQQAFQLHFPAAADATGTIESETFPWKLRWHHLAYCNSPSRRQIYIDGKPLIRDESAQADVILDNWAPGRVNLSLGKRQPWDDAQGYDGTMQIRSFRLSSGRRYDGQFEPPESFFRDERTVVLLDIAHQSGQVVQDLSGNRCEGLLTGAKWMTVKKLWQ